MSSPVASRSSRPLKRSASMASLPTPPRTNRRRKNGKLRSLHAAEEEERDAIHSSDEEEEKEPTQYKKRRISSAQEDDEEAAFWMVDSDKGQANENEHSTQVDSDSDSDTTTSFLSRRGHKSSTVGSAPVSPPPSRRRLPGAKVASIAPATALKLLPVAEESPGLSPSGTSPPETPKSSKMRALIDSPENPFLASPLDLDKSASTSASVSGSPKGIPQEKPTVTYVFRGVKKTYPNPYYDHEKNRTRSPDPNSLLPPEHQDFSPDLRGAPRALWPRQAKKVSSPTSTPESPSNRAKRRKGVTQTLLADSDDELDGKGDEEDNISLRPVRLFGPGGLRPRVTSRP
jgi:hypothetical protein